LSDFNAPPSSGARLGRYLFLGKLAEGPFGPLYELRDDSAPDGLRGLARRLSLPGDLDPDAAQAIASAAWDNMEFRHESILSVADVVFGDGWLVSIHDHAEGSSLRSLLLRSQERKSTFPVSVALRIVSDVLDGLEQIREQCKSTGITWTPGGAHTSSSFVCGDGRTRLLDGQLIANFIRTLHPSTRTPEVGVSPPELLDREKELDERTNVFAAGAILLQLLSGTELRAQSARGSARSPAALIPNLEAMLSKGVDSGLSEALRSALRPEPSKRPATIREFKAAIARNGALATNAQVIEFVDALLYRESTLFRLVLDPLPKLSDKLRSIRPTDENRDVAFDVVYRPRPERKPSAAKLPRTNVARITQPSLGKQNVQPPIERTAIPVAPIVRLGKPEFLATPLPRQAPQSQMETAPSVSPAPRVGGKASPFRTLVGLNPRTAAALQQPNPGASNTEPQAKPDLEPKNEPDAVSVILPVISQTSTAVEEEDALTVAKFEIPPEIQLAALANLFPTESVPTSPKPLETMTATAPPSESLQLPVGTVQRTIQLRVSTAVIVAIGTAAIAVAATILVQRVSAKPSIDASAPSAIAKTPSPPLAMASSLVTPAANLEPSKQAPLPESTASAPSGTSDTSTNTNTAPPSEALAQGNASPPPAPKITTAVPNRAPLRRKRPYVPHGL
jgi:hypothetical protein